ncbi:MAG: 4-hydroxybenzoate octaprenyltransferase [Alphaproteobacteria bacterium]|nr:4-hydroxybenzoate octaprenyltransferase [Alphaproteobacteria bacterium]
MFSDIDLSRLVFTKTPESWHPYIKLTRIDRPAGIWLLLAPCLWGIILAGTGLANISLHTCKLLLLFALGAALMRTAGCIVNDLWDMKLDAAVERTKTRPLASGEIGVAQALRLLGVLLALALLILVLLPRMAILLGVLSLLLVAAYPAMKRITWVPQLFLGFTFNWGALMGWAAVTGHVSKPAFLLYAAGIFWTLAYDTIYAHQDKEDDALVGVRSTARLFGAYSKYFVALFFALSVFFLLKAKYAASPGILTPLLTALPAAHAIWQLKNWNMDDPPSCLRVFKSNQIYGLLALLMLAS